MPGRVKVLLLGPGVFGRNQWNIDVPSLTSYGMGEYTLMM